jgi:hypothetical protein
VVNGAFLNSNNVSCGVNIMYPQIGYYI